MKNISKILIISAAVSCGGKVTMDQDSPKTRPTSSIPNARGGFGNRTPITEGGIGGKVIVGGNSGDGSAGRNMGGSAGHGGDLLGGIAGSTTSPCDLGDIVPIQCVPQEEILAPTQGFSFKEFQVIYNGEQNGESQFIIRKSNCDEYSVSVKTVNDVEIDGLDKFRINVSDRIDNKVHVSVSKICECGDNQNSIAFSEGLSIAVDGILFKNNGFVQDVGPLANGTCNVSNLKAFMTIDGQDFEVKEGDCISGENYSLLVKSFTFDLEPLVSTCTISNEKVQTEIGTF